MDEELSIKHANGERRSTSAYKILAGAGGGGFLTFIIWLLSQTTDPIIRDQVRLETKLNETKLELLTAIKEVKLENKEGINVLMNALREDKTAQWRIDDKQNLEISELKLLNQTHKSKKEN